MSESNRANVSERAACRIDVRSGTGHLNLRGPATDTGFKAAVKKLIGIDLPTTANTTAASEGSGDALRVYWLGPDEWQIVTSRERAKQLSIELNEALAEMHASVNDLSGGFVTIVMCGEGARTMLAKGCTLTLDQRRFGPGACAQTTLAKANVLLGVIDDEPAIELIVRRSFGDYVLDWLETAAKD